jgi:hypothetical protein
MKEVASVSVCLIALVATVTLTACKPPKQVADEELLSESAPQITVLDEVIDADGLDRVVAAPVLPVPEPERVVLEEKVAEAEVIIIEVPVTEVAVIEAPSAELPSKVVGIEAEKIEWEKIKAYKQPGWTISAVRYLGEGQLVVETHEIANPANHKNYLLVHNKTEWEIAGASRSK